MAMTRKRAERLTGYEVRELATTHNLVRFGAFRADELIATGSGAVEWLALEHLVRQVYTLHARLALQRAHWRCTRCRTSRKLQIHHRRYRSHGGTHEAEKLEPVCWDCHRLIHAREGSK